MTWSGASSRTSCREKLGHKVFVDNRGGAGGVLGTEAAANAAPDGYTLLVVSIAHAVNPSLYKLNYDPIKSFAPISIMATGPNVLAVNPTLAGEEREGAGRAREGEARLDRLCVGRRRQLPASRRRAVQARRRREPAARALQGRRARDAGRDRRAREGDVLLAGADHAVHPVGAAARARRRRREAQSGAARRADHRRRPACRATWRTTGGASWRPPARRSRSSTSSTGHPGGAEIARADRSVRARGRRRRDHEHGRVRQLYGEPRSPSGRGWSRKGISRAQ